MTPAPTLQFSIRRLFLLSLVSFVAVAALLGIAANANKSNRAAKARAEQAAEAKSGANPLVQDKQPQAPAAAVIVATLTDNTAAATKVAPGGTINYTGTITNNGAASPADDATNLNFSAPLDANTTLVAGSVHASPLAANDTYNWVGNTQLDTVARVLPAVTANDIAVNAPGGTDTFTLTAIAGGATALGGVVTLASPSGSFVYTPPVGRPNLADPATVQDSFTYTITNSADPTLTATGTVRINLTGRVWYLVAGGVGDGRSNAPSGSPSAMSTAADKSTDVFYIFSNAGSLNGPFSVDADQQLLGQGVNLVVSAITLFNAAAPTPTTTNTAGNCVALAGAPGNNTLSGFNIGNCTSGTAIVGANVGTLNVSTVTINTNGGGLDLTGVGTPTVSVTLGGLTSSGGAKNVNLSGLNGSFTLGGGALSGAAGNAFDVNGGNGGITYSGTITNSGGRQVNIINKTAGIVAFSGNVGGTGTGIFLNSNTGATFNFTGGIALSTGVNAAFTATGGGTVNVNGTNTITTTSGTAVNITDTIGASNVTFQSVAHNGNNTAIILSNTGSGTFSVTGTGTTDGSGGTIQNIAGADAITLNNTGGLVTLKNMFIQDITAAGDATDAQNTRSGVDAISGLTVNGGLTLDNTDISRISDNAILGGTNGVPDVATVWTGLTINNCTIQDTNRFGVAHKGDANNEGTVRILGIRGTVNITNDLFQRGAEFLDFFVTAGTLDMTVTGSQFLNAYKEFVAADNSSLASVGNHGVDVTVQGSANANVTIGDRNNAALGNTFLNGRLASVRVGNDAGATGTVNVTLGRNIFRSNDHTSGVFCNPGCATADFDFPQAGVLLFTLGTTSSVFNATVDNNLFDEATNASGGVGQLTLSITRAIWQALVTNNTFDTPGNAPWFMRADGNTTTAKVKFLNNAGIRGAFCSTDAAANGGGCNLGGGQLCPGSAGYCGPGLRSLADVQNGGKLDLTIDGDDFAHHDTLFDPGQTFEGRAGVNLVGNSTLCLNLMNNTAPDGYSLEQFNGNQTVNVFRSGGSGTCTAPGSPGNCQTALQANNNTGGSNNPATNPPFVNVVGTVNVVSVACQSPSLAMFRLGKDQRDYLASNENMPSFRSIDPNDLFVSGDSAVAHQNDRATAARNATSTQRQSVKEGRQLNGLTSQMPTGTKASVAAPPITHISSKVHMASVLAKATPKASAAEVARIYRSERPLSHHAIRKNAFSQEPNAPIAGENVTLNTIATFPAAGKSITIKYSATVNTTVLTARQATTQGTITANAGAINVTTTDPGPPVVAGATVTLLDTTLTWTGATDTDWNTATNWNRPGPVVSSYAPGVSNPAVNDVIIPNVGAQPTISATDIGIYSLNISNGRTLTITPPRILTIGGSPGGDLTLDGIISGGFLNLGTGMHVINNAGGTGSLSSTNVATVLSGGTVTLNNNLQAGALGVNAGGSMNISNRTLSLNGSGAALVVPGGATFITTGSTVIFNGTAAQTAAGVAYNNLTINNTIGTNITGVTLTGNATVNGVLALTSSDLATGAFTLTQPNTTASTGVSDVVGTVIRSGGPFGLISLTFGNPNNIITFTGTGTRPTTMTVVLAKAAPATYAAAVQRNYTMSQTGGAGFTATVRLHYLDSELNGNLPETSLGLRRLRTADSHWVAAPPPPGVPTREGAANWIEATGVLAADLTTQWTFSTLVPTASGGTVTGRIVDQSGNPVEGAVVRLEGTQNRKFITDANGVYRFDNVTTNGFYTLTPARANYSFTPSVRSFSQLGDSTEAAFGATLVGGGFVNPLDTPEYFVRQHYVDFLNREPDEAGFNFWSDQIIECGADQNCIGRRRENVSAAYFLSIEFQKTGGLVDGLYRASYGVAPQYSAFMPDTRTVGHGVRVGIDGWEALLEANTEAFVNSFVNRPEFHQLYDSMDNSLYVDTLISHTGVSFTSAERDALVSGLGTGTMTRAEALRSIAENRSFVSAKFNQTFVMMEYYGYLRRDYDAGGYAFWLNKLNEFNGNFEQAEMVKAFIISGEYRDRFPR